MQDFKGVVFVGLRCSYLMAYTFEVWLYLSMFMEYNHSFTNKSSSPFNYLGHQYAMFPTLSIPDFIFNFFLNHLNLTIMQLKAKSNILKCQKSIYKILDGKYSQMIHGIVSLVV